ncbi:MAG TPA: SDR family oxidoreductase [Acidimicrobiales bacterium]|jgi:acetoacetyl-CoA reductase/3-oxoacyl-[acyl-carrier protein] reductase|nr:SDR family oxidoreductase [Acidimicrobiales bacterium]
MRIVPEMGRQRVALVTGGTRGLGAAISNRIVGDGNIVAAVYRRNAAAADAWCAAANSEGLASVHCADVGQVDSCQELVAEVIRRYGRVDYLVNNAGALVERRLADIGVDQWDSCLRQNLSSAFYLSRAVLPTMTGQRFGRVVNIGSVSAAMGSAFQVDYAAAKSGLIGLTRSLARSVARKGVTVNCVVPGGFDTAIVDDMTLTDRNLIEQNVPVGRFGRPEELAHVVVSLLHDEASYTTGSVIVVDGGLSMGT